MRIDRIARPDALCDASMSAQTSGEVDQVIINPIDFGEISWVGIAKEAGALISLAINDTANL